MKITKEVLDELDGYRNAGGLLNGNEIDALIRLCRAALEVRDAIDIVLAALPEELARILPLREWRDMLTAAAEGDTE